MKYFAALFVFFPILSLAVVKAQFQTQPKQAVLNLSGDDAARLFSALKVQEKAAADGSVSKSYEMVYFNKVMEIACASSASVVCNLTVHEDPLHTGRIDLDQRTAAIVAADNGWLNLYVLPNFNIGPFIDDKTGFSTGEIFTSDDGRLNIWVSRQTYSDKSKVHTFNLTFKD